jgi:chromosome segregation ATPase
MSEDYSVQETKSSPSWQLPSIIILALLALGALGFAWSNSTKLDATKQAVADQMKAVQQSVQADMTGVKDRLSAAEKTNTDLQGDLKVVTGKLKITQGQLKKAREEAAETNSQTTEMVKNLDTSVHTELATKATSDDVKTVDTKVTKVGTDLDKTISDLNMARSELGTLIART